jgi:CHAT domain
VATVSPGSPRNKPPRRKPPPEGQLFVIRLPVSNRDFEVETEDFFLKVRGAASTSRSRLRKPSKDKIVILFMGANPADTTQLALTREAREIDNYLRSSDFRDRFRLEQQWETQANELPGRIMRFKPTIVHFSGHGSCSGELVFHDADGKARPARPAALADTFRLLNDKVRCVLLNACYSERQAKAIAKHIETVIGMSHAIADSDAIAFSRAFYEALGFGKSIRDAFDLARNGIDLSGLSGSDLPKLHCRADVNPAHSFLV